MINLEEQFSPRVNPGDANYPFGSIKDNTSPGANDGTPLAAVWGNDWEGFAQAAMTEAGITPSGLPDTAQDSQLLDAVKAVASGALRPSVIEALLRSYAEAGYNLVDGSFEAGGTLVNANDVLLQGHTGKAFSGPAGPVAAGTNPASGGFVDRSGAIYGKATVAAINSGMYGVGATLTVSDRAGARFNVVAGGTPDGYGVLAAGAGKTAVYQIGGYADVAALGAKPDWSGVSGTDSYGAFNYAVTHYTQPIYVPAGANPYYISAPIPSRNLLSIFSDSEVVTLSLEGARIYAPTGFLLNGVVPETRHRISIENVNVYGAGKAVAGVIAISGQFGGEIEGSHFDSFDTIMSNNMAYLLDFRRTKFTNSKTGLLISTANESNIANCFFSGVDTPIDTYSLTPGASGDKAARPITISRTNFNIDANSKPSVLSGSVVFVENYVEWFGVTPAGMAPFEFVAMRFAPPLLTVTDNEFNAHNNGTSCWRIYSDHVSGSDGAGEIAYNRFGAFTAEPIVFGGKAGFYDLVTGVNVHDNPGGLVAYPAAQFAIPFHATSRASFDGTLAIAGTSYVSVPYTADAGFVCNIPTSPGSLRIIQSGLYRVDVSALLTYTAPLRTLEYRIAANGVPVTGVNTFETLPAIVAGGNNYHTIQTSAVAYLTKGMIMELQIRNGETLSRSTISMQMLTESNVYVPK